MKFLKSFIFIALFVTVFVAKTTFAATLAFYPSAGTFTVGQTFTVSVLVSSPTQAVNAYSGDVAYPTNVLSLLSVSKAGSIVNFWSSEPSGSAGDARFEGITVDPGYTGAAGKIVVLTFKAIAPGTANLKFSSSSVLANDGQGTSVLEGSGTASFTITGKKVEPEVVTTTPILSSVTHPDSDAWYGVRVAEVDWQLPAGVTDVSYTTNANPNGLPYAFFGLVKSRFTPTLRDGVWYTHVRFKTANGVGPVAHFKTQIDGTAPTIVTVKELNEGDDAFKKLELYAEDALSGISGFGISIDGGEEKFVTAENNTATFETATLLRGTHTYTARAYDKAKNMIETTGTFEITHLDPPVITSYEKSLVEGDFLVIRGTTYPDTNVEIEMIRSITVKNGLFDNGVSQVIGEPLRGVVASDHAGRFTFAYKDRLLYGTYAIGARVVLADGTVSNPSETISIPVIETLWHRILRILMMPVVLMGSLGLIVLIVLIAFIHKYRKYHSMKNEYYVEKV